MSTGSLLRTKLRHYHCLSTTLQGCRQLPRHVWFVTCFPLHVLFDEGLGTSNFHSSATTIRFARTGELEKKSRISPWNYANRLPTQHRSYKPSSWLPVLEELHTTPFGPRIRTRTQAALVTLKDRITLRGTRSALKRMISLWVNINTSRNRISFVRLVLILTHPVYVSQMSGQDDLS